MDLHELTDKKYASVNYAAQNNSKRRQTILTIELF